MRKVFGFLLGLMMLFAASAAPAAGEGNRYEGPGFDSPEEALMCYIGGIKELDFEKILSAYAWETQISHYSIEKYMSRIRSYSPAARPRIPSEHPFVVTASLESLRSFQVDMLYRAIEILMLGEHYHNGMTVMLKDEAAMAEYFSFFDTNRLELLAGMTNIRLIDPKTVAGGLFASEVNQRNFNDMAAVYGGDETVNIIALADLANGETFYCCPTIVRYGSKWYVVSATSYTSMLLGVETTQQPFFCGKVDF